MTDPYAPYVIAAYGAFGLGLGALIWSTLRANARARAELESAERDRAE